MFKDIKQYRDQQGIISEQALQSTDNNEAAVENAITQHRASAAPAIFNRKERKVVRENIIAELSQGFEHRRESLAMVLEARLHSVREACNHVLVTGKTHLRQQRMEYFGEVYRQVEKKLNGLSEEFLLDVDRRFSHLDRFSNDYIRRREQGRLERSVDDFLTTVDKLMDEFRSIIEENVGQQQGAKK